MGSTRTPFEYFSFKFHLAPGMLNLVNITIQFNGRSNFCLLCIKFDFELPFFGQKTITKKICATMFNDTIQKAVQAKIVIAEN